MSRKFVFLVYLTLFNVFVVNECSLLATAISSGILEAFAELSNNVGLYNFAGSQGIDTINEILRLNQHIPISVQTNAGFQNESDVKAAAFESKSVMNSFIYIFNSTTAYLNYTKSTAFQEKPNNNRYLVVIPGAVLIDV